MFAGRRMTQSSVRFSSSRRSALKNFPSRMLAIDAEGQERWRVLLGAYTYDSPVIGADGTIYISTERGAVQAWRRTDE